MSDKILVTIGIPILLVLGGCTMWGVSDPMLDFNRGEFRATVYTEGHPSETLPLPVGSPLLAKIDEIIKNRKGEWKRSYNSFAPVIFVESEDCKINVQPSRIIVNYRASSGEWSQVITNIDRNQYSQVEKVASDLLESKQR
jgi:hypothetical protein